MESSGLHLDDFVNLKFDILYRLKIKIEIPFFSSSLILNT